MLRIHILAVAAGVLALIAAASSVQAKAGAGKALHGVVMAIQKDAGKETGTITVKSGGHKNKKTGVETPVVMHTIQVASTTTFVKVSHKPGAVKGSEETTPSKFGHLKDGDHVSIEVTNGAAVEVKIHHHKKAA